MKCPICNIDMEKRLLPQPPKRGRGKILISKINKIYVSRNSSLPDSISLRIRGREIRQNSSVKGDITRWGRHKRYARYDLILGWDGKTWDCPNADDEDHILREEMLEARKEISYFEARKKGLLYK